MAEIYFKDKKITVQDGSFIQDACEEMGIPFACAEGICGTCIIEVKEGHENLSERTQEEIDFLGETTQERLACQCKIKQGCVKIDY